MSNKSTQFKPGVSGNPNGRPPKGFSITDTMKEMLNSDPKIKQALGAKLLEMALKGDMTALKTIWSYMDGLPSQDFTSGGEALQGPIIYMPKKLTEQEAEAQIK